MDRNERLSRLILALGNSLDAARIAYEMVMEELSVEEAVDTTDPHPLVASENPALCQHPDTLDALDQSLCASCGTNLSQ